MKLFPRALAACLAASLAAAPAGAAEASLTAEPARYAFVDGDAQKFSAHHWIRDGFAAGVREFSLAYDGLPQNATLAAYGRALIDENDLAGRVELKKDGPGLTFLNVDWSEFRKYFDGTGGVYKRFGTLRSNELDRDLELDVGHLAVEAGLLLGDLPEIVFSYDRRYKEGAKSRLTWAAVREGTVTRNIGPSWQELEESVDAFAVRTGFDVLGFRLDAEERVEHYEAEYRRRERSLSTTSAAADRKVRLQEQDPESRLMTTTLRLERWFDDDAAQIAAGYRFADLHATELESIYEMTETGAPQNFGNPKQIRDATAGNAYQSHTWVASFMADLWEGMNVVGRFKSELVHRESDSLYPSDTTPAVPDGIIDTTEASLNDSKIVRFGEGISLRYTGIPRTALYGDLELEEIRNWLSEDRRSIGGQSLPSANEVFGRETLTRSLRGAWTVGARISPWPCLDLTSQFRHRWNNNDYDDLRETLPGSSTARSAFIDEQNVRTDEFTFRATARPWKRVQPSVRYQLRDDDYLTRAESDSERVEADAVSHSVTADASVQLTEAIFVLLSYTRGNALVETPARFASSAHTPAFHADVGVWSASADYAIGTDLALTAVASYARADNFNDFSDAGLPLGSDYNQLDLELGLRWKVREDLSVEPRYAYYRYHSDPDAEIGDYDAHVVWLQITLETG
jgi:hypothetical protein